MDSVERGKRIRDLRQALSMSQETLSDKTFIAVKRVREIERGSEPTGIESLFLATALEVTVDDICHVKSNEALSQAHEKIQQIRLQCLGCPGYEEGKCPTCFIEQVIQGIVTDTQRQQLKQARDRHKPVLIAK